MRHFSLGIRLALLLVTVLLECDISAREWREESFDTNYYLLQVSVVDGATCNPVAGAEIVWIGGGGEEQVVATDTTGELLSFLDYPWSWATSLYARQGNRVSQMHQLLGGNSLTPELALGAPASLTGTIRKPNGAPLSDCKVRLKVPSKQPVHFVETTTNSSGTYRFEEMPPGEYYLVLEQATHFAPFSTDFDRPTTAMLHPGATTDLDITMEKRAFITGKVLTPDGVGAPDVTFSIHSSNRFQPSTIIRTDDKGNFEAWIVPSASTPVHVGVESDELGSGTLELPPLESGDSRTNLVVHLGGAARVRGVVRDPAGNPIPGVQIGGATTQESGGYVTKALSVSSKGTVNLHFYPPHPRNDKSWLSFDSTSATWYRETEFAIAARHGEELVHDVVLQPMIWRELRGRVLGPDGIAAVDVEVLVYCGAPLARQWLDDRTPVVPRWQEPYPPVPYSSILSSEPATLLARCRTNTDGRWEANVLPEASNPVNSFLSDAKPDPDSFAVVVSQAEVDMIAVQYFSADGNPKTPGNIEVTLAPLPNDLKTELFLVDKAGLPMPGVRWINQSTNEVHTSDASGALALPRIFDILHLKLLDSGLRILGANLEGEIVSPAPPSLDPPPDPTSGFGRMELGSDSRTSGDSHVRWDASRLYFVDFDDEKARLVVTLARNEDH